MTKDKAIAELVRIWHSPHLDLSLKAGLGEAIEALQAEMEGDLISRGEAVALVNRAIRGIDDKDVQEYLFDGLRKQMWALPSAEPNTGHWIDEETNYLCSKCHRGCWVNSDYCPWCGADMRGEEG